MATLSIDDPRLGVRDEQDFNNPAFGPYLLNMNVAMRQADGSILRIYRTFLSSPYVVQHIRNPGVLDRRRRKESREQREKLLETMDREAGVNFFNEQLS